MRNRIWLVIGAALGLLSVVLIRGYIQQLEAKMRAEFLAARGENADVAVAAVDIPEQTLIESKMVSTKSVLADALQPHALTDPERAVGEIALVPIYAGEQLRDSVLGKRERANTLSMKTPPGKRAVTVAVDALTGSGGFIRPGDFVDIVGIFQFPGPEGGQQTPVTVTLLQRVPVLAVGNTFSESPAGVEKQGEAGTVTLALNPQEAQLIVSARTQGNLQLVLRPKADSVIAELPIMTPDVLVAAILGAKAAPKSPVQPPKPPERRVELYRGLEKEIVVLPSVPSDDH